MYTFAVLTRHCLPFQMNTAAKDKITTPIAPIVLNTFAMPTADIQTGMANTKIVLIVFRQNVTAVRASPIISACRSARENSSMMPIGSVYYTIVGV